MARPNYGKDNKPQETKSQARDNLYTIGELITEALKMHPTIISYARKEVTHD